MKTLFLSLTFLLIVLTEIKAEEKTIFEFSGETIGEYENGAEIIISSKTGNLLSDSWQPDEGKILGGKEGKRARTSNPIELERDKSYRIDLDYNSDLSDFSFGYLNFEDNEGKGKAVGEDPDYIEFKSMSTFQNRLFISTPSDKPYYIIFNFKKSNDADFTEAERTKLNEGIRKGNFRLIPTKMESINVISKNEDISTDSWQPFEGQELGGKPDVRRRITNPITLKTNNLNKIFVEKDDNLIGFQFGYMAFEKDGTTGATIRDRDIEYPNFKEIIKFGRGHDLKTIGKPFTYNNEFSFTVNFRKNDSSSFTDADNQNLFNGLKDNLKIYSYYQSILSGSWEGNVAESSKRVKIPSVIILKKTNQHKIKIQDKSKFAKFKYQYFIFKYKNMTEKIGGNGKYEEVNEVIEISMPRRNLNSIRNLVSEEDYYYLGLDFEKKDGEVFSSADKTELIGALKSNVNVYILDSKVSKGSRVGLSTGALIAIIISSALLLF